MQNRSRIIGIFNIAFSSLFVLLSGSLIFINNSNNMFQTSKQLFFAFLWLVFLLLAALCGKLVWKKKGDFLSAHFPLVFVAGMVLIFLLQGIQVYSTCTLIGWDCNNLITPALSKTIGSYNTYLSQYPHNIFSLLMLRALVKLFKFFGITQYWLFLDLFNTLCVDVAITAVVFAARRIRGVSFAFVSWFLLLLFLAFTPYLVVPYTDTFSMPFIAGAFYFYCVLMDSKSTDKKFFSRRLALILFPLCLLTGFLIKPTSLILLIACMIIFICFRLDSLGSYIRKLFYFLLVFLFVFVGYKSFHSMAKHLDLLDLKEELAVPFTHYLMMGSNTQETPFGYSYGAFNMDDIGLTTSFNNRDKAIEANLREYQKRVQAYGPSGYAVFLLKKARWVTSEGDFYWGDEGSFADWTAPDANFLRQCIYPNGSHHRMYTYLLQGLWILYLSALSISFLFDQKKQEEELFTVIRCAILGSLLFILLFEGRSRYLLNYLPLYAIPVAQVYQRMSALLTIRKPK